MSRFFKLFVNKSLVRTNPSLKPRRSDPDVVAVMLKFDPTKKPLVKSVKLANLFCPPKNLQV